jgi:hypothetical protein
VRRGWVRTCRVIGNRYNRTHIFSVNNRNTTIMAKFGIKCFGVINNKPIMNINQIVDKINTRYNTIQGKKIV